MKQYWKNFNKYKRLLKELVIKDIKLKYRRSYLGVLWTMLNPLLMMLVLTIVFSTLFKRDIPNFPVYLLSGRILFEFYSQGTKMGMNAVVGSSALIKKVYVPKYIFPLSKVLFAFINLMFSMVALVIVIVVTQMPVSWTILLAPIPLIYLLLFSIGVSFILGSYTVFFRDIEHLYSVALTAWMYFTPLFYPADIIPQQYQIIFKFNPLYYIIEMFRDVVMYGKIPTLQTNLICLAFSFSTLIVGVYVFYKKQDKFILYI